MWSRTGPRDLGPYRHGTGCFTQQNRTWKRSDGGQGRPKGRTYSGGGRPESSTPHAPGQNLRPVLSWPRDMQDRWDFGHRRLAGGVPYGEATVDGVTRVPPQSPRTSWRLSCRRCQFLVLAQATRRSEKARQACGVLNAVRNCLTNESRSLKAACTLGGADLDERQSLLHLAEVGVVGVEHRRLAAAKLPDVMAFSMALDAAVEPFCSVLTVLHMALLGADPLSWCSWRRRPSTGPGPASGPAPPHRFPPTSIAASRPPPPCLGPGRRRYSTPCGETGIGHRVTRPCGGLARGTPGRIAGPAGVMVGADGASEKWGTRWMI